MAFELWLRTCRHTELLFSLNDECTPTEGEQVPHQARLVQGCFATASGAITPLPHARLAGVVA